MSDRLTLAAIENAGIERPKAERLASVIFDAIHDKAAKAELKADAAAVRVDVATVRSELNADIDRVEAKLDLVEHRLMTRLGGLVVVLTGILFAALHYWPPVSHG